MGSPHDLIKASSSWPDLRAREWRDTFDTLHMWSQVVGKVCLALTAPVNHYWNVTFRLTPDGLATPLLRFHERAFAMTFDFTAHQLRIDLHDGTRRSLPLEPRTVADFYHGLMNELGALGIDVRIWTMPVEVPNPIPFERDTFHHTYNPPAASAFWHALVAMEPVFAQFRSTFIGKCSPLHFFWGSFDLALTRFSGRRAPERPEADAITREAYSHEVISHGFWLGSGAVSEPAFYAYAAPEPRGFKEASIRPSAAFYSGEFSNFVLPYDVVRNASSPSATLMDFLESTYLAGAELAGWDRTSLEKPGEPSLKMQA